MNNDFILFTESYYDFLMKNDLKNSIIDVEKPSRFKIKNYDHYVLSLDSELLLKYNRCINAISSKDIYGMDIIKDYIIYMRYMEKCFMYKNDKSHSIYADISEESNNKVYRLYLNWVNFESKICIEFKSSNIKNPATDSFIDKIISEDADDNIDFITITISREFGKNMKNTFKFISNSLPTFNDESDKILYNNIIDHVYEIIMKDFHFMINHIAEFFDIGYIDMHYNINTTYHSWSKRYNIFERLKKDGLWVRKYNE